MKDCTEDEFVMNHSNNSLNEHVLRDVYKYMMMMGMYDLSGADLWLVSLRLMTFKDFCWMWFLCKTNKEFIDMIMIGSINVVRQVYNSLSSRKSVYRDVLGEDGYNELEFAMDDVSSMGSVERLGWAYESMLDRVEKILTALCFPIPPPGETEYKDLWTKTVGISYVKPASWNSSVAQLIASAASSS